MRLALAGLATAALVLPIGVMWHSSLLPDTYDMALMGTMDLGGGEPVGHAGHDHTEAVGPHHHATEGTPVADLVGATTGVPDVRERFVVSHEAGRYLVNGSTPGPVLRAREGDLVEVVLANEDVAAGATLHWHGIDVPNAMDGVAGVTQDAVMPGEEFAYRFVAEAPGTYWYHSHQVSHEQVRLGLLGAVVIQPREPLPVDVDALALMHGYGTTFTVNGKTGTRAEQATTGDRVRVRVVNSDNTGLAVWVRGAPYTVAAIDGRDLNEPDPVRDASVLITAGGRADLELTVPEGGARVDFGGKAALTFGGDPGKGPAPRERVDLLSYGEPAPLPFDVDEPDRSFEYSIGRRLGFLDGKPGKWWTINGKLYPDVPMYAVRKGDVVVVEIDNHSGEAHPMHLHGHHAVVLERNGKRATGTPWWVDSLEVATGDRYRVAFLADNPGLWMDHCHNLPHAAEGLIAHLMYDGVRSSYRIGGKSANEPE